MFSKGSIPSTFRYRVPVIRFFSFAFSPANWNIFFIYQFYIIDSIIIGSYGIINIHDNQPHYDHSNVFTFLCWHKLLTNIRICSSTSAKRIQFTVVLKYICCIFVISEIRLVVIYNTIWIGSVKIRNIT